MPDERLYDIANLVCEGDTLAAYGTCSWTNVYVACARALCLGDRYLTLSSLAELSVSCELMNRRVKLTNSYFFRTLALFLYAD